jgi:hypothetical protein
MEHKLPRRKALKLVAATPVGLGAVVEESTVASAGDNAERGYDERMKPGARDLGHSVLALNNEHENHRLRIEVSRVTSAEVDPIVFESEYELGAQPTEPVNGERANVIEESDDLQLGKAGVFDVEATLTDGRSATTDWRIAYPTVPANQAIRIRIRKGELNLKTVKA